MRAPLITLALFLATVYPPPLRAQRLSTADVVGLLRKDGFVVPFFEWSGHEWLPLGDPGESSLQGVRPWQLIKTYFARERQGQPLTLRAGSTVRLWGQDPDAWAHLTDLQDRDVVVQFQSPVPRIGYAVSVDSGHAPFVPAPARQRSLLTALFGDSLEILANEQLRAEVWAAQIRGDSIIYFRVTRQAKVQGCPDLHVYEGWLRPSRGGAPEAVQHSRGDCEGKGTLRHHPWALLDRNKRLFAFLMESGWDTSGVGLWNMTGERITRLSVSR